jgi:hypothetical protein
MIARGDHALQPRIRFVPLLNAELKVIGRRHAELEKRSMNSVNSGDLEKSCKGREPPHTAPAVR